MTMNRAERRKANKRIKEGLPRVLMPVPRERWPEQTNDGYSIRTAVWLSRDYLVQLFDEGNGVQRMSVNSTTLGPGSWADGITWDDLMGIKHQIGLGDHWAVEVFPANESVVNVSNMRHLWVLPEAPAFAWRVA
jgi:hypothetical protein